MGGVPKKRHTRGSRNQRRMHLFIKVRGLTLCKKCGHSVLPHTVCANCGYYKDKQVFDVLAKLTRKEKKAKEKEIKAQGKAGGKELNAAELSKK
ncbi:50S ribosomal protein L32 [Candidatus Woesebacteria bacterium RBG_16_39_8b]|uniref:Large ribosomal subunit protein bL32 n=1 Tax=Candidatus Woesebacteria bacterium RBG_16_39_8b TaxID=1802482 RepID=A0A1F7XAI0_9BACT|nr:MAG: 50S ribosomal protein L32 [Candidatus Woesebacteria bacterium RBG_16_39_8b]